jgi:hypothetical protein
VNFVDLHNEEIVMMLVLFGHYLERHLWRELNQRSDRQIRCGIDNDVPPAAGWVDQRPIRSGTPKLQIARNNRVNSRMKQT